MTDLLCCISSARAAMLMRGHEPGNLRLIIGADTLDALLAELRPHEPWDSLTHGAPRRLWGMPVEDRIDRAGFMVVASP